MIGYLAQADGAPCPTLVLPARTLPDDGPALLARLADVRRWLAGTGRAQVLKIALVAPSRRPRRDLEFRFVQCLPGGRFDTTGNCGHSLACAALAAARHHLVPFAPGRPVRVHVANNDDHVVCETDTPAHHEAELSLHFVHTPAPLLSSLLPTGNPVDRLTTGRRSVEASLVSAGNPYVFVDAADLGLTGRPALFTAGDDVLGQLRGIRAAAARLLGRPPTGAFPKIAAIGGWPPGPLTVRALSVPAWHPTLALTGAVCLAVAATLDHTLPARLTPRPHPHDPDRGRRIEMHTPGGPRTVTVTTTPTPAGPALTRTSVHGRRARILTGPLRIPTRHPETRKEVGLCLPPRT
ncbi:PrpF domain-containing protein [Streptomyces sp. NPDC048106]|uniref:PrpF domain-containing protein n=1 Tax=Streptomyces sp. NPDC048106 TaxID=3155750 RepID=UPI003456138B